MDTSITTHCTIRGHRVYRNGQLAYAHPAATDDLDTFLIAAYRHFGIQYPKFFKMDALCKLAFLTAELLLQAADLRHRLPAGEVGIALANKSSSLLTDLSHQRSIEDPANYFPSPAVFVYTLPNIMIGEVSIRHQITGENTLFVTEQFDAETLESYVSQLLADGLSQACVCGWIEAEPTGYESFFYLVEQGTEAREVAPVPHQPDFINSLYSHSL